MSFFGKLLGNTQHTQSVKHFEPLVAKINALEESFKALSDQELKAKTVEFRRRLGVAPSVSPLPAVAEGAPMQASVEAVIPGDILSEAFAAVREAARRTLGQRHFDVQLIGGMVLDSGAIAEMRTGEGKTLVATLSAYLNALSGKGVHIVTVNDYLSRRDAVWMGQIYDFLGLTVGVINHEASFLYDSSIAPQGAAGTDSGPSSEAGGVPTSPTSYSPPRKDGAGGRSVVPPATIVGEEPVPAKPTGRDTDVRVDHKLDKERDDVGAFKVVHEFLRPCTRREAYAADITYGTNNEFGFDYLRDNLEYSPAALRQRPFNYAIVDEIDSILIDEARTPLIISAPSRDAESTYKQFAALVVSFKENEDYEKDEKRKAISLLPAGIEKAEKALGIDNIYTNAGIKYVHHLETAVRAKALFKRDKEYVVKDNQIVIVDEFTGRLQPGRRWSEGLHQAIEAKEGVVIQQESRTYATITFQNFFRMYPKLSGMTGTAATSSEEFYKVYGLDVYMVPPNVPVVRADKNDQIFRTEPGKFKAIARKVKELHDKGQPVLIGTVSIERNELLSQFLKAEGIPHTMLNAKPEYAEREGETVAQAGKKGAVTIATNMAGRGVDIKLGGNPNTKEAYEEVKRLGGLFVLGTERHEARRIDNQLRGRSGRQGDPGETQFFVSLEDTLMRVFASDTLKSMMGRLGMAEDEPIEHRLISKALESAQEKIEGFNFDSRKHVLEFDDVINTQRSSVYSRRRRLLLGNVDDVEKELFEILGLNDTAASPDGTFSAASLRDSRREIARFSGSTARPENLAISTPLKQSPRLAAENVPSGEAAADAIDGNSPFGKGGAPERSGGAGDFESVIQKKISEFGRDNFLNAARIILLQTIDMYWVEHLEVMDYTRGSVNLRAYGQRDPLVEYKKEGLRLFREMQNAVREQVVRILPNIVPVIQGQAAQNISSNAAPKNSVLTPEMREVHENARIIGSQDGSGKAVQSAKKEPQFGRNDPCWCGSGKKYKKCHGKNV